MAAVQNLRDFGHAVVHETDIAIVGGGAAGLTIAREFFGSRTQILVVESGELQERAEISALNAVESIGEPASSEQALRRAAFHGANATSWSHEVQPFGVRCRVLGGSTHAWIGKSAAFDDTDFRERASVPGSGWPFGLEVLGPYLDRAGEALNLGPNVYDERLWEVMAIDPPEPAFDPERLSSFFWQFARSRRWPLQIMRLGAEFLEAATPNVRILLNATATEITSDRSGRVCTGVKVSTLEGRRATVRARAVVLACGGIENPRLMLASMSANPKGMGNQNDVVGRYLQDHVSTRLGYVKAADCGPLNRRFGFWGVKHRGRVHMFMHGVALSRRLQEREQLLNCAAYMLEERSADDPWDALKRLLQRTSEHPIQDLVAVASCPGLLMEGAGMRLLEQDLMPKAIQRGIADLMIGHFPNAAARGYLSRGWPHKLDGLAIDGICEQAPNPDSRILLSTVKDRFGMPLARIDWRIDDNARRSLMRLGSCLAQELERVGLPRPDLEDWIIQNRPSGAVLIDMAHTSGATRMSRNPREGVVDENCRVHDVDRLYVAGASVFPTSGHANPTLMILALAIRLADRLKRDLAETAIETAASGAPAPVGGS